MRMRPIQAEALAQAREAGGLLGAMGVGSGKTLVTLLLGQVLKLKAPLLLLPAALVEKTRVELIEYSKHYKIAANIRMVSYDTLSRANAAEFLTYHKPDGIICDEVHKLKNRKAAVTRRVARYKAENPGTVFCGLSGTLMSHDLKDFGHFAIWALMQGAPVPMALDELEEWALALEGPKVGKDGFQTVQPGALLKFATPEDHEGAADETIVARRGFRRRLLRTPGVVATNQESVQCALNISTVHFSVAPATEKNFNTLRQTWETPDGWALSQAVDVWRVARELALGLHYVWDPRPPREWLERRREWAAFVRETLSRSRTLDSELQVAEACRAGALDASALNAWESVRNTFKIQPKPVWHDSSALEYCEKWLKKGPGIVWVQHTFFGEELAKRTGLAFYSQEARDAHGNPIAKADPRKSLIASIGSISEGHNLQSWALNLVTSPPTLAKTWEQMLGRTHRQGQTADEVTVETFELCLEHYEALTSGIAGAHHTHDTLGQTQKLLLATISRAGEFEVARRAGQNSMWSRGRK
jgi:hypothetical protein